MHISTSIIHIYAILGRLSTFCEVFDFVASFLFYCSKEKFPPNIYYKIFTHRNIVDMCANAPRDYTKASTKRLPVEYIHNKGQTMGEGECFEGP